MIKKLIIFVFLLSYSFVTYAHPLDISNSTIWIKWNKANINTYFHSFEIDYLLKLNWLEIDSIDQYIENKPIIIKYIKEKIFLSNEDIICIPNNFEFYDDEIYNILTQWFRVSYQMQCETKINNFKLEVLFFNNFPLQTNKFKVYDLNKWYHSILYKVLTPKLNHISVTNLQDYKPLLQVDTDCDWLSNEDEKIYKTDINKIDTDWDNYSDYDEVVLWFNPLDSEYWPWQDYREKLRDVICKKEQIEINKKSMWYSSLDSNSYWIEYLKKILKYISNYIDNKEWNIFYVFLIVYVLWIIHAAWPWHSKSLLVAYTIEKENWYKKWFIYALVFSISHILDILLLFLITTIAFQFIDISKFNYYIQFGSIIILFLFSIYLVYKSFIKKTSCEKSQKKTLLIAFLSWLAPCSFAWSIYFLLLSLWKFTLIVPLIISLWLWILTTLIFIVLITVFLKEKSVNKTKVFSKYSSKISAIIILIISSYLLFKVLSI